MPRVIKTPDDVADIYFGDVYELPPAPTPPETDDIVAVEAFIVATDAWIVETDAIIASVNEAARRNGKRPETPPGQEGKKRGK